MDKDTRDWPRASGNWFESLMLSPLCPLLLAGGQNAILGTRPSWRQGVSLFEAKGRQNVMRSRGNCLLQAYSSLSSFHPSLLPAKSATVRHRVCLTVAPGAGWWHCNTPSPLLPASCMTCIGIHGWGGGGESFQILDAVEFNVFCFLACPHPSLGRRAPLSSECECCSVSACLDSPNPFFSFPTAKSQAFSGNSSHLTYFTYYFNFNF